MQTRSELKCFFRDQGVALIDVIQLSCSDPEVAKKELEKIAAKLKALSE
jgi:hypothetical protein